MLYFKLSYSFKVSFARENKKIIIILILLIFLGGSYITHL